MKKSEKKEKVNEKRINLINGITLVSLVITIVIMLILAAISICFILGKNGLLNKTKDSVTVYKDQMGIEEQKLEQIGADIEINDEVPIYSWENEDELINDKGEKVTNTLKGKWVKNYPEGAPEAGAWFTFENPSKANVLTINFINQTEKPMFPKNAVEGYSYYLSKDDSKRAIVYYTLSDKKTTTGNDGYDMYVVSQGKVQLPENINNLFHLYNEIIELNGFYNVDMSQVTDMSYLFAEFGTNTLKKIILPDNFDTSHVEHLESLFTGSNALDEIVLGSGFSIESVFEENKNYIFSFAGNKNTKLIMSQENKEIRDLFNNRKLENN